MITLKMFLLRIFVEKSEIMRSKSAVKELWRVGISKILSEFCFKNSARGSFIFFEGRFVP